MSILFFSRLFYPHIGGVEKHVLEISRLLIKKGHKITVVAEQDSAKIKQNEIFEGIKIYRIPSFKDNRLKKFKIWKWLWNNRSLIKNADIVHCHDVFFWYLPFKFLYFGKPVYITFHGYEDYPLRSKNILIHKISEKLSNGSICIGDFIRKWYGTKPTYTTYGGVGISNFILSKAEGQISNKINKKSAVFIGRLDEQTGIKIYVDAVKLIKKRVPDFKFEIVGDGKFRKEIEENFKVLGFQENPEEYFLKYNFAFVSRYLSILEAMVSKKLVFAVYDNPLKEDYLRMAPFARYIVISGSSSEIVTKISFYLDNPREKEKLVENAYKWVKKNTWRETTNMYIRLWQKSF